MAPLSGARKRHTRPQLTIHTRTQVHSWTGLTHPSANHSRHSGSRHGNPFAILTLPLLTSHPLPSSISCIYPHIPDSIAPFDFDLVLCCPQPILSVLDGPAHRLFIHVCDSTHAVNTLTIPPRLTPSSRHLPSPLRRPPSSDPSTVNPSLPPHFSSTHDASRAAAPVAPAIKACRRARGRRCVDQLARAQRTRH